MSKPEKFSPLKHREVVITQDEIYENNPRFPGANGYRGYIAERFLQEHGVTILNFTTLQYFQSQDLRDAIKVRATIGKNCSGPKI